MRKNRHLIGKQQGVISVLFILLSSLLVGVASYSLYIGQAVKHKIELQNAADAATLAMAQQGSQGLNMIAANNLTIGAAIHINTSVEIAAAYISLYRALTASIDDLQEIAPLINDVLGNPAAAMQDTIQKEVWNRLAPISSYVFRIALGTMELNNFIAQYWLYPAPIRGAESLRLNKPDAIFLPFQQSTSQDKTTKMPLMTFSGLHLTKPKDTVCQSLRASKNLPAESRDNILNWLAGPLQSMDSTHDDLFQDLQKVFDALQSMMVVSLGHVDCGFGLKTSLFQTMQNFSDHLSKKSGGTAFAVKYLQQATSGKSVAASYLAKSKDAFDCDSLEITCKIREKSCHQLLGTLSEKLVSVDPLSAAQQLKAIFMSKAIEDLKRQQDTLECQGRKGYLAVVDASGSEQCFHAASIEADCPIWEEVHKNGLSKAFMCSENRSYMNEQIYGNGACATYRAWKEVSNPDPKPNDKESNQQKLHSDLGLKIMDTGKQAELFATESLNAKQRVNGFSPVKNTFPVQQTMLNEQLQLAFMIPAVGIEGDVFEKSLQFGSIAAVPLRTRRHIPPSVPCDPALQIKDADGHAHCDFSPFISLVSHQAADTDESKRHLELINMNHGGLTKLSQAHSNDQQAFVSSWQRSLWVLSEASIRHEPAANDPVPSDPQMRLFYPAWRSHFSTLTASSIVSNLSPLLANDLSVNLIAKFKGSAD